MLTYREGAKNAKKPFGERIEEQTFNKKETTQNAGFVEKSLVPEHGEPVRKQVSPTQKSENQNPARRHEDAKKDLS
jgi:hypothetical protein